MQAWKPDGAAPIKAWIDGVPLEDKAREQVENIARMPFVVGHIAVMPDVHWGMGATIGSVIPTKGAIIPAAVGVDIGCGMIASETTLRGDDIGGLRAIRDAIEKAVPVGRTNNGGPGDRGAWNEPPEQHQEAIEILTTAYNGILLRHPKIAHRSVPNHLATLGTGNHFIEVCLDERGTVWIVLHSGSRGPGNKIGTYFIERAKEDMRRWFINLPDVDLAYITEGSDLFRDYWKALDWAQEYARMNRALMMQNTQMALRSLYPQMRRTSQPIDCHHNYVAWEHHDGKNVMVTRKGAVRARDSDLGVIPGSMGTCSYIVRGKGNAESFHSCSHGAGRRMSRGEARRTFSMADHEIATAGVECRKDSEVIDETPGAYKDIDAVMDAQHDLVDIIHTLKQVVCVKG